MNGKELTKRNRSSSGYLENQRDHSILMVFTSSIFNTLPRLYRGYTVQPYPPSSESIVTYSFT